MGMVNYGRKLVLALRSQPGFLGPSKYVHSFER
jgi:hypothetical protein